MSCEKEFTISEVPPRLAHWPMETVSGGNLVDCILSVPVPYNENYGVGGGLVGSDFVPGIIGNAIHFYHLPEPSGFLQISMGIPATSINDLNHNAAGFSLCAWIKINAYGEVSGNGYGSIGYFGNGNNGIVRLFFKNGESVFLARDSVGVSENVPVVLPATGVWFFLHMFQDVAGGKMGIQFDNGAITYASFAPNGIASTGGLVQTYQAGAGWIPNDWIADEITVRLDKPFTPAQLAYLYNSGLGRTCPITLP